MRRRKDVAVKGGRCPTCGERGFPYLKPVKAKGRSYTYLYYGHYSREKYRKSGKSHLRWCYVGREGLLKAETSKQAQLSWRELL